MADADAINPHERQAISIWSKERHHLTTSILAAPRTQINNAIDTVCDLAQMYDRLGLPATDINPCHQSEIVVSCSRKSSCPCPFQPEQLEQRVAGLVGKLAADA